MSVNTFDHFVEGFQVAINGGPCKIPYNLGKSAGEARKLFSAGYAAGKADLAEAEKLVKAGHLKRARKLVVFDMPTHELVRPVAYKTQPNGQRRSAGQPECQTSDTDRPANWRAEARRIRRELKLCRGGDPNGLVGDQTDDAPRQAQLSVPDPGSPDHKSQSRPPAAPGRAIQTGGIDVPLVVLQALDDASWTLRTL